MFNGLNNNLGNLYKLTNAKTRSVSPENFTAEKGKGGMSEIGQGSASHAARELGKGWKVNPFVVVKPGETFTMADIKASGAINHIWLTTSGRNWRDFIFRIYWDGSDTPSVECPIGDFFCSGWGEYTPIVSLPVCVNPGRAFNCYWNMPFKTGFKVTLENRDVRDMVIYYQIDYTEAEHEEEIAYFHAQYRRTNPLPYGEVYTIVDGIKGKGQFVGTYMAWQVNNNGWWGEGEIKFYMDGDDEYATIVGTGTEDYFCGSYNFENPYNRHYEDFTTPYAGFHQILRSDELYRVQKRFGMYRWHITDPIRFEEDLKVTIQALGWRSEGRYLPLKDDIASVAYWYQTLPAAPFPPVADRNYLEVN